MSVFGGSPSDNGDREGRWDGPWRRFRRWARRTRSTPRKPTVPLVIAGVVMFAQSALVLIWVVRQLAQDHPECAGYCNVLDGPLVRQAPYGFLAAAIVAILGYAVARGSRIGWWLALLTEGAFGMGVVATDVWGEDVVSPGYLVLSALLVVGLLIGHDAFTAARRFIDSSRE